MSVKKLYTALLVLSISGLHCVYLTADTDKSSRVFNPYGGYYDYHHKQTPQNEAAKTLKTLNEIKKDLEDELTTNKENPEALEDINDALKGIKTGRKIQLKRIARVPGWKEALFMGFAGETFAKRIQDFDLGDVPGGAFTTALGVKMASGFGAAADAVVPNKVGAWLSLSIDKLSGYCSGTYHYIYKKASGRHGDPFDYDNVEISKRVMSEALDVLLKTGSKAGQLGGREKVARFDEKDEEVIDPLWLSLRTLMETKIRNQIAFFDRSLEYYRKDSNSHVVLYAQQIRDGLSVLVEHVILKTKSYKDLGSAAYQTALQTLRQSLDTDYKSLLSNLPKAKADGFSVDGSKKSTTERRERAFED